MELISRLSAARAGKSTDTEEICSGFRMTKRVCVVSLTAVRDLELTVAAPAGLASVRGFLEAARH